MVIKSDASTQLAENVCEECGSTVFVTDQKRGEVICEMCGLVIHDHKMDMGPEWRVFNDDSSEQRIRTGAPASFRFHDKGLTTQVGFDRRDASGNKLSAIGLDRAHHLRKWQQRTSINTSLERNLATANNRLNIWASQMKIPPGVIEPTAQLYRRATIAKIPRGRSIDKTLVACILITCRTLRIPRTIQDFARVTQITSKDIGKYYRLVKKVLEIPPQPLTPEEYLLPVCENLAVSPHIRTRALALLTQVKQTDIPIGKDPNSIAITCLYVAGKLEEMELNSLLIQHRQAKSDHNAPLTKQLAKQIAELKAALRYVTQQRLSNESGISDVVIRNRYRDLCTVLKIDLPN